MLKQFILMEEFDVSFLFYIVIVNKMGFIVIKADYALFKPTKTN